VSEYDVALFVSDSSGGEPLAELAADVERLQAELSQESER
jgi:hypothetical protein